MNLVEELKWRGMIHDIMPDTEEQLNKEATTAYAGFDPTADSLHIGHLVSIMMLKHLQLKGHKPIALIGGATGMIGDPSGKSEERNLLSEEVLRNNEKAIKRQLLKFLDYDEGKDNAAEVVNNYDWFKDMPLIEFLRDTGKHLTLSYMMTKDSVQKRLETGISYTEFTYQLIQGYDFYWLYKNKNCKLQVGGSDQWGNIVTGTELIRRREQAEAFALTSPLLTKADGNKFGKTEGGNIWLDPAKTTPYQFYQFWINVSDEDARRFFRIFSLKTPGEITTLEEEHQQAPHKRVLQRTLAEELTTRIHSEQDMQQARTASDILFGKGTTESLQSLDEDTFLSIFEGVPQIELSRDKLLSQNNILELISSGTDFQIFSSKGEARKMIKNGGVNINKSKISNEHDTPAFELLQDKYLLIQKGKKNYFIVKAV